MFGQINTRRPPKNFSLLYLQNNEVYFVSLKVCLLLDPKHEEVDGKLHLCSRSLFFEPKNIAKPLLRFKFSSSILLRLLKNIETKKAQRLSNLYKSEQEIKNALAKGPTFIYELLEAQQIKKSKQVPKLNMRLFEPPLRKRAQEQKTCNCFFLRSSKVFIIHRKPMSPYIVQKTQQSYIFTLNKTNPKLRVMNFLKLYDQIVKSQQQQRMIRSIIATTLQQSAQQLLEIYQQQKLQVMNIIRCKRINIEGYQYGQLVLLPNKFKYYPLINSPDNQVLQFAYREIKFMNKYRYMMQHIGIELWMYNFPYSLLLVFSDHNIRQRVYQYLKEKADKLIRIELTDVTEMWANGEITNAQYLNIVNIYGNRSLNDISQYPIFPWILHSYNTDFDMRNPEIFRDLAKPIGAINKHRLRKLKDFYEMQTKDRTVTIPHLYPTHYSNPGYTFYFLIRKIPEFIVRLQNEIFSPSQRIFRCVESAYESSMNSAADFKQLIPEFYSTDCDFLVNSQKLDMGSTPEGQPIDDVLLPKWANNAQDFLLKMRAAFESDYVSAHLNQWIDLIFGYKQSGTPAISSDNIFYYLTYEQNVNLQKQMTRVQRSAIDVQIAQFGQTPIQLFEVQHPTRRSRILNLDVGHSVQDKHVLKAKVHALGEQNQRLQEQLQRQRYRFNNKLNQKQQLLQRNHKDKKREIQKIKGMLAIDTESLRKFNFKYYNFINRSQFKNNEQKDVYIRQIEQLLKRRERQNGQMNVIIAGMKRQINQPDQSINSQIEQNAKLDSEFFMQPL